MRRVLDRGCSFKKIGDTGLGIRVVRKNSCEYFTLGEKKFELLSRLRTETHGYSDAEFRGEHFAVKKVVLRNIKNLPKNRFSVFGRKPIL